MLYEMLAESSQRASHCRSIAVAAASTIEARQQNMLDEISDLREAIDEAGIGGDRAAEDRYIELLKDFRALHQGHALTSSLTAEETIPDDLQKALDRAKLMHQIYRDGVLIKGAQMDLVEVVRELQKWQHPVAHNLLLQLQGIAGST